MSTSSITIKNYASGLTLICEQVPDVSSAAVVIAIPSGVIYDPAGRSGMGAVMSELLFRGAGDYDNRALNEKVDMLGLHRHCSVQTVFMNMTGALISDNLPAAVELFVEVIRRPRLEEEQLDLCKALSVQSLDSLEDDPRQKISYLARQQFINHPYNQCVLGVKKDIEQINMADIQGYYQRQFTPRKMIIAVAGNVNADSAASMVERYLGGWQGVQPRDYAAPATFSQFVHHNNKGNQVHIAVMFPSVHYSDGNYYNALLSVSILSGGMGSRLFTEVREKRGLCYAVGANHIVFDRQGAVFCYVGSSPDQAQQALDVMMEELKRLAAGVTQEELQRAKVGLRASLVMQGESTSARASGCAADYYHLGRVRTLEEIEERINAVTLDEINSYIKNYPAGPFSVTTLGPCRLKAEHFVESS